MTIFSDKLSLIPMSEMRGWHMMHWMTIFSDKLSLIPMSEMWGWHMMHWMKLPHMRSPFLKPSNVPHPVKCKYSNFKCILKLKSHISENVSEDFKGKVKRIFKGFTKQGWQCPIYNGTIKTLVWLKCERNRRFSD